MNEGKSEGTLGERTAENKLSPVVLGYVWGARILTYSIELGVLTWLGWWIDKTYSLSPWGIIGGSLIGFAAFWGGLFATAKRLENEEVRDRLRQLSVRK